MMKRNRLWVAFFCMISLLMIGAIWHQIEHDQQFRTLTDATEI